MARLALSEHNDPLPLEKSEFLSPPGPSQGVYGAPEGQRPKSIESYFGICKSLNIGHMNVNDREKMFSDAFPLVALIANKHWPLSKLIISRNVN